jgi:nucleoside-diphosphate-sugar epimerase
MREPILVTGGAGYLGVCVVEELVSAGASVRVLDVLLHRQDEIAAQLESRGALVIRGDLREEPVRRKALQGARSVVHLAGVVGDPACANDPARAREVNLTAGRALVEEATSAGVERILFASTCSNYGRVAEPGVLIAEDGPLVPVSLYAEQKVEMERLLLAGVGDGVACTCLRFATLYGVAPRMRFDLTVNEFVRDLWCGRRLEVFGEQFWRPYVHVGDAARAVRLVCEAREEVVAQRVFNVGTTSENYRKRDLLELIRRHVDTGSVVFVHRDEDPRDYKVSFERIKQELGFEPSYLVSDGIVDILGALEAGRFPDPFDSRYRNIP